MHKWLMVIPLLMILTGCGENIQYQGTIDKFTIETIPVVSKYFKTNTYVYLDGVRIKYNYLKTDDIVTGDRVVVYNKGMGYEYIRKVK